MRVSLALLAMTLATAAPAPAAETVPVPGFRSVELRGGGEVTVVPGPAQRVTIVEGSSRFTRLRVLADGKLRIDTCAAQCPNHYRMRIEIQSPRVPDLAIHGGGAIATRGGFRSQGQLAAAIDGGGKIDARTLDAVSVSAAVNGGGEILVRPRTQLSAAVNGGGLVRFWGHPNVNVGIHGGGAVTPAS